MSRQSITAFYDSMAQVYEYIFPLQNAQVNFVHNILLKESVVLDVGCATGALALALGELGHKVTGIDLDKELLEIACKNREKIDGTPLFINGDMTCIKDVFSIENFQAGLCFGNTLSHLSNKMRIKFLRDMYDLLEQGGTFAGQIVHYDNIFTSGKTALPVIDNEYIKFIRNYDDFSENGSFSFNTRLYIKSSDKIIVNKIPLFVILKQDLENELAATGFKNIEMFGSYKKTLLKKDSFPLIFTCQK